jgi:hypothetical protein
VSKIPLTGINLICGGQYPARFVIDANHLNATIEGREVSGRRAVGLIDDYDFAYARQQAGVVGLWACNVSYYAWRLRIPQRRRWDFQPHMHGKTFHGDPYIEYPTHLPNHQHAVHTLRAIAS